MKILVFGKYGQVGGQLTELLNADVDVELTAVDNDVLDLTDVDSIMPFIADISPDWVINASAYTAVDAAETDKELCFTLNARVPAVMAKVCKQVGAHFFHYSTDYVFDGTATVPYDEADSPNPKSAYGQSKLDGEREVMEILPQAVILRTAWVYSKTGKNFVNTMLRLAESRPLITVVDDQHGSPTLADDLAQVTVDIIRDINGGVREHKGGIFHATGGGQTTWFSFCEEIMALSGNDETEVRPITTAQYPTPAHRPAYSVLSNKKLADCYGQVLPHWTVSLRRCLS